MQDGHDTELRKLREELRRCQEHGDLGSWRLRLKDQMFESSAQANIHLGFPPDYQPTFAEVGQLTHPEDLLKAREAMQRLIETGQPYAIETRFICPDRDSIIHVISRGELQLDNEGRPRAILGTNQNITSLKNGEQQQILRGQIAQSHKFEILGKLASGITHDHNNMLCAILCQADLAMLSLAPENPLRKKLQDIVATAERSSSLSRQLLSFITKRPPKSTVFDLNDAVTNLLNLLSSLMGAGISINWVPPEKPCHVQMDSAQLEQVIVNLCVNARDAIKGTGHITIETSTIPSDDLPPRLSDAQISNQYVRLRVIDDGCGMDEETLSQVFEPLYSKKEHGEGTGLGLAIIHDIVLQNSGYIDVQSQLDNGTHFSIFFPHYDDEIPPAQVPVEHLATAYRGDETILFVEDEPSILHISVELLRNLGYHVLSAATPDEAMQQTQSHSSKIHLLVTDVDLPKMNGLELSTHLKKLRPDLSCLYVSGYTSDIIAERGELRSEINFLQKPFSIAVLAQTIRNILG